MTIVSDKFATCICDLDIQLEPDAIEYITSVLGDLDFSKEADPRAAIRESTLDFLEDANVDPHKVESLYDSLLSMVETSKKEPAEEEPISKKGTVLPEISQRPEVASDESKREQEKNKKTSRQRRARGEGATARRRRRRKGAADEGDSNEEDNSEDDGEPPIIAISQQSRFHTETLETSSIELDLPGVNISVGQVDLLVDAHLKFKAGVRYGLVGQNGVGKTILMRSLADNILVGLPQNLTILHVAQLQVFDEEMTVLKEVVSADRETMQVVREAAMLQNVMHTTSTEALQRVVYELMVKRSQEKLDLAIKIATKRSGARGREARREQIACEESHAALLAQNPLTYVTPKLANETMSQVFEKLELIDTGELEARAQKILRGLGFKENQMNTPVAKFSGGWRMKIALAKSLLLRPDILLLDEPTNHLDLPAILWLQEYLLNETEDQTIVIVSHDRSFLNAVTEETIIFKDKQLKYHAGNFEDWDRNTEEQRIRKQNMLVAQERRKKHIMASIQHNVQQAKATGDDKRLGLVASRKKKLERMGMEKTEDGKWWKSSTMGPRQQITIEQRVKTAAIKIPDPPPLRYHGPLFSLKNVTFRYPNTSYDIVSNFSLDIEMGSRIAFLGGNGSGKTTILELMTGRLAPTSGQVYRHNLLRVGYFSQHAVDELDLSKTPVEAMTEQFGVDEHICRAHLGSVGIGGPVALRKMSKLSGGQRNRVALAFILYKAPHVLVLDEITNHLDMGTVDTLVEALTEFSGALVLVSHDVWFMKQLLEIQPQEDDNDDGENDNAAGRFYVVKPGKPVKEWEKGLDAYVESVLKTVRKRNDIQ